MADIRHIPPPPPWRLCADIRLSAWLAPLELPAGAVPSGWRPVRLGESLVVGAICAEYLPGGTLAYRELAVGALVRKGLRLGVTTPWIWVDSEPSLRGGRRFWAVPKDVARFVERPGDIEVVAPRGPLAKLTFRPGAWPRLRLTAPLRLVQPVAGGVLTAPGRLSGVATPGRARWTFFGPAAALSEKRPWFSVRISQAVFELQPGRVDADDKNRPAASLRRAEGAARKGRTA